MRAALGGAAIAVAYPLWAPDSPVSAIGDDHDNLRYVSITRDNVVQNVTAAGTLEAVDTVEVSSQLSGQVAKLMADHNSRVRAGEPLAALDGATFEVLLKEAEASRSRWHNRKKPMRPSRAHGHTTMTLCGIFRSRPRSAGTAVFPSATPSEHR